MLPVCIRSYLKSVLRYKFVILDTYHPYTVYLHQQECEDLWLFSEAKRGPRAKMFGQHWPVAPRFESEIHSIGALLSFSLSNVVRNGLTRYGQCHLGGMCSIYCLSVPSPPYRHNRTMSFNSDSISWQMNCHQQRFSLPQSTCRLNFVPPITTTCLLTPPPHPHLSYSSNKFAKSPPSCAGPENIYAWCAV
jgi:hypothetical protein